MVICFTNSGWVAPLSNDGLKITGENKKVYDGWVYPKSWETEGDDMYLESPKLLFKDGYYYMTSAEGGTAGPATSHMCVMARSRSIFGPLGELSLQSGGTYVQCYRQLVVKGHGTADR